MKRGLLELTAAALVVAPSAGEVKNLTLYRITPRNYTGVTDLDTGDAAGDAFFGLYEKSEPISCGKDSRSMSQLLCDNDPLLQIPGFNVYIQVQVEVDTRFGNYAECNPSKYPPHNFECTHHSSAGCWYANREHPEWATEFADLCSKTDCYCKVIESEAVGQEFPRFGAHVPPGTPPSCSTTYYPFENYTIADSFPVKETYDGVPLSECCTRCTAENADSMNCGGYVFEPAPDISNGTCKMYGLFSFNDFKIHPGTYLGYSSGVGLDAFVQHAVGEFSDQMAGAWYSTQAPGECTKPTDVIGKDCWWRLVNQTAQVNATCVNNHMINTVVDKRPNCFSGCPQPKNQTSDCFIGCLFETLAGNASATPVVPPMSRQSIIDAFESAFTGDICDTVPDCPEPCRPPCWAVPEGAPCDNSTTAATNRVPLPPQRHH